MLNFALVTILYKKREFMSRLSKYILLAVFVTFFISSTSFALNLAGGQITFDVPDALELRSKNMSDFNNAFSAILAKRMNIDYSQAQLVLQQKGFNEMTSEGLSKYCRVMLEILPPNQQMVYSNKEFAQMVRSLSVSDLNEFNQMLIDAFVQTDPFTKVHQWLETNSVIIGGKFALKYHYERYSTSDKNKLVDVCTYIIVTRKFVVHLTCSYRINDKLIFESAINQFLSSLRINAE